MAAPVSVVIPCYKAPVTVIRAVESVARQTTPPEEIIVVDDGSPDGGATARALEGLRDRFPRDPPVRIILLEQNGGPAVSRNAGWNAATGRYVAFLDCDDTWHPRKLEIQTAWMEAHPEVAITTTRRSLRPGPEEFDAPVPADWNAEIWSYHRLLTWNRFPTSAVMLRRALPHRFPAHIRWAEDFTLWLRIVADGHQAASIDLPLCRKYKPSFGASGVSSHLWSIEAGELRMYTDLLRDGKLSALLYPPLISLSLLKFARRAAITGARRLRRPRSA